MTQEEKQLLLVDLCARLPYGLKFDAGTVNPIHTLQTIYTDAETHVVEFMDEIGFSFELNDFKPYLRPMSSMTEEEFGFLQEHLPYDFTRVYSGKFDLIDDIHLGNSVSIDDMIFLLNCLNKWHLDYRGLIEKRLALEAPEEMYVN